MRSGGFGILLIFDKVLDALRYCGIWRFFCDIAVFVNFFCGIAVFRTPQCPPLSGRYYLRSILGSFCGVGIRFRLVIIFSSPEPIVSFSRRRLGTRREGLWRQTIPEVLDSMTSGLHVLAIKSIQNTVRSMAALEWPD